MFSSKVKSSLSIKSSCEQFLKFFSVGIFSEVCNRGVLEEISLNFFFSNFFNFLRSKRAKRAIACEARDAREARNRARSAQSRAKCATRAERAIAREARQLGPLRSPPSEARLVLTVDGWVMDG